MDSLGTANSRYQFGQTNWSRVLQAGQAEGDLAQQARNELLIRYHDAVYRFLLAKLGDTDVAGELFGRFAERVVEIHPFLQRANPEKGRFRDYLKTVLSRMIADYYREIQSDQKKLQKYLKKLSPAAIEDVFGGAWVEELMKHAWEGLERRERTNGQPFHTLLLYKARNPKTRSEAMATHFSQELGKPMTADNIRQLLHRGQEMLNDLLVEEVARSLQETSAATASAEEIEAELIELKLFDKARRDALDRYRERTATS